MASERVLHKKVSKVYFRNFQKDKISKVNFILFAGAKIAFPVPRPEEFQLGRISDSLTLEGRVTPRPRHGCNRARQLVFKWVIYHIPVGGGLAS